MYSLEADISREPDYMKPLPGEKSYKRQSQKRAIGRLSEGHSTFNVACALQMAINGGLEAIIHHTHPECESVCQHADYVYYINFVDRQITCTTALKANMFMLNLPLEPRDNWRVVIDSWKKLFHEQKWVSHEQKRVSHKQKRVSQEKKELSRDMEKLALGLAEVVPSEEYPLKTVEAALEMIEQGSSDQNEATRPFANEILTKFEDSAREEADKLKMHVEKHKEEIARAWNKSDESNLWGYICGLDVWAQGQLLGAIDPQRAATLLLNMRPHRRRDCLLLMKQEEIRRIVDCWSLSNKFRILDQVDCIQRMELTETTATEGFFIWTSNFRNTGVWDLRRCAGCEKIYKDWDVFSLCECESKTFHKSCGNKAEWSCEAHSREDVCKDSHGSGAIYRRC
jgi:hypothetical protein